jgi:hypothetical protein
MGTILLIILILLLVGVSCATWPYSLAGVITRAAV